MTHNIYEYITNVSLIIFHNLCNPVLVRDHIANELCGKVGNIMLLTIGNVYYLFVALPPYNCAYISD